MKIILRFVAIFVLLIAGGWIAATSGNPSFAERFRYSLDMESCLNRTGCWDFARHGCVFAESAYSKQLQPTPEQKAAYTCYPNNDGERLGEAAKHRMLW